MAAHPEWQLTQEQRARGNYLIRQRQHGYSVAHLCGRAEFLDFCLRLNQHVLAPRPETETLVAKALSALPPRARILEWGTGSGALALAIARARPDCRITALDCSRTALNLARRNALALRIRNLHLVHADWRKIWPQGRFDLILANPPYIAPHDEHLQGPGVCREPRHALIAAQKGTEAFRILARRGRQHARQGGRLVMEHGNTQGAVCRRIVQRAGWGRAQTLPDLSAQPRITCARR